VKFNSNKNNLPQPGHSKPHATEQPGHQQAEKELARKGPEGPSEES